MKVKPIKNYFDRELKKDITPNSPEFEVTEERAKVLVSAGVCEVVAATPTPEKVVKKPRAKKEA
jgi:hypothetical protein